MAEMHRILDYRILKEIGKGAASTIYAVSDTKQNLFAMKHVLLKGSKDDRFLEQAENEEKISAKLNHKNIRKIYKIYKIRPGLSRTEVAVKMEFLDSQALNEFDIPELKTRIEIFREVAEGLAHMNDRGFVHADMKPTNVLIDDAMNVKIIDLGQACKVGTIKERIQGTPGYMAPEQASRKEITERTDVYNFGATMYWLLTRQEVPTARPEQSVKTDGEGFSIGAGGSTAKVPPPPHTFNDAIPEKLSEIVIRCLQPNPNARFEDMHAVVKKLGQVIEGMDDAKSSVKVG